MATYKTSIGTCQLNFLFTIFCYYWFPFVLLIESIYLYWYHVYIYIIKNGLTKRFLFWVSSHLESLDTLYLVDTYIMILRYFNACSSVWKNRWIFAYCSASSNTRNVNLWRGHCTYGTNKTQGRSIHIHLTRVITRNNTV